MNKKIPIKKSPKIEFAFASFLLMSILVILLPLIESLNTNKNKTGIINNLKLIRKHSKVYFEKHDAKSVSLYEIVGPKKKIKELKIFADEIYPDHIYEGEYISVITKKYGLLKIN